MYFSHLSNSRALGNIQGVANYMGVTLNNLKLDINLRSESHVTNNSQEKLRNNHVFTIKQPDTDNVEKSFKPRAIS